MEEIDKGESWIKAVNALIKTVVPGDGIKITGISAEDISNQLDKEFIDDDEKAICIDTESDGIIDDHASHVYTDSSAESHEVKITPAEEIKLSDSITLDDWLMEHRCVSSAVSTSTHSRPSNPFIDDWITGTNINNVYNLPALTPVSKPKKCVPVKVTEITKIWDNLG